MKKFFLILTVSLACTLIADAQKAESSTAAHASNQTSATARAADKSIRLDSGTRLTGQLQNSIDARHARVGDQVVLKTTQAIKSNGRTVVSKGSRLVGRVTEVARGARGQGESRIGILFDRLEQGSLQVPITATISSITGVQANGSARNDDMFGSDVSAGGSARSTSSVRSSGGGNGGLLGGAVNSTTSTVGSVVGSTTSAVGSTVNSTTGAVGNTTRGLGRSLSGIQISQSSSASAEGGSVLSVQGDNLHLEKGTNFNLVLTESTNVSTSKQP